MTKKLLLLLLPLLFFWGCETATDSGSDVLEFVEQTASLEIKKGSVDFLSVMLESSEDLADSAIDLTVTDLDGKEVSLNLISFQNIITKSDDLYSIKSVFTVSADCSTGIYKLNYSAISGSLEDSLTTELVVKGDDFVTISSSITEKSILKGSSDSLTLSIRAAGKLTNDSISFKVFESNGSAVLTDVISLQTSSFNSIDTSFVTSILVSNECVVDTYTVVAYARYADLQDSVSFNVVVTSEPFTYVAIGASDAVGVGAEPVTTGYVYVISDSLKTIKDEVTLTNLGVSGYVAEEIHHDLVSKAINAQPDLVTIWVGGNDLKNLILTASADILPFSDQVDSIFSKLSAGLPNAKIVAANMPDFSKLPILAMASNAEKEAAKQLTLAINGVLLEKATRYEIELVDLYTADYIADPTTVCSDGFHPSTKGYKIIGDSYFKKIKEIVE